MKTNGSRLNGQHYPTLGDLIAAIDEFTHNTRLNAAIVADLVNRKRVRLEGLFKGKRVQIR